MSTVKGLSISGLWTAAHLEKNRGHIKGCMYIYIYMHIYIHVYSYDIYYPTLTGWGL